MMPAALVAMGMLTGCGGQAENSGDVAVKAFNAYIEGDTDAYMEVLYIPRLAATNDAYVEAIGKSFRAGSDRFREKIQLDGRGGIKHTRVKEVNEGEHTTSVTLLATAYDDTVSEHEFIMTYADSWKVASLPKE